VTFPNTRPTERSLLNDGNDDQFELSVEPGANALQIFEHPYAYAAWRGVDYPLADLRQAA
jgi:hypothetical protein